MSLLLISLQHMTVSGIRPCYPNFLLMAFLFLSVKDLKVKKVLLYLISNFHLIDLYLLLLTVQHLLHFGRKVVFNRDLSSLIVSSFHKLPPQFSFCCHSCVFWYLNSSLIFCCWLLNPSIFSCFFSCPVSNYRLRLFKLRFL